MSEARGLGNVKPKAGSFVLAALLVALSGVFLGGRAQGWFEEKLDVRTTSVRLPADSTLGLQEGAEVQILGNTVGAVTEVKLDETKASKSADVPVYFTMRIRGPLARLVREDSTVQIKRKFGVAGTAYVLIAAGQGAPAVSGKTQLACAIAPDLTTTFEKTLDNFNRPDSPVQQILANAATLSSNLVAGKGTVGQLLSDPATAKSIDATLANVQALTTGLTHSESTVGKLLNDPKSGEALAATLANIQALTAGLNRNEGMIGKLLNDAKTGEALAGTMANTKESLESINKLLARANGADINGFMEQLRGTLGQVDKTLQEVTATTAALRQQVKDLPVLISQTQEMMRQTTRTIEGMQKTWLLRDHVAAEGSTRLSPGDVAP